MTPATATRPRLGYLGDGWIGRHRRAAVEASGVAVTAAVADPAVEGALDGLDELLALRPDGIVIATPSALHPEQALAALELGIPVFCQKPLALDATSARRVVDAARAADVPVGVDLSYRLTAAALCVYEAVRSGELGEVFAVDLAFHNAYGPDKAWYRDPALCGGGCLLDLGIHLVDLALWALGSPRVEQVEGRTIGGQLEHYAAAQLELEGGILVRLACSWYLHAGRDCVFEAAFHGTAGGVAMRNVAGSFYDFRAERSRGTSTELLAGPPDDWGGRTVVEWAERVARGDGFDPAAESHVAVHDVLDRIYGRAP
jgi:predicted dehydrogenase